MVTQLTREMGLRTCPEYDQIFCGLADKMMECSEFRVTGCIGCPVVGWCDRVWNQLCQIGSQRYIREEEKQYFESEIARLKECAVYAGSK